MYFFKMLTTRLKSELKNKTFLRQKSISAVVMLAFMTCQLFSCAYGFSIPFKKNKPKNTTTKPAVQMKAEVNKQVEYSLEDCINIALANDPNIKVAKTQKDIANSQVGLAKSDYFPNITIGNGFTSQHNKNSGRGGGFYNQGGSTTSDNNYYQLNLGVNQLIWDFGSTVARINMQKYNRESVGYDLENTILNTVYNVKMAYFQALAALANQDVYERSVRINKLNYERTNALFQEGLKSKIDVVNAQVYLTDAEISLINAQGQYQNAIVNLNNAMYYPDAPDYTLKNTESFNFQRTKPQKTEVNVNSIKKSGSEEYEQTAILTSGIEKQEEPVQYGKTVAGAERDLIIDTLKHTFGNRTQAANILGISIRTLRNKLKQYEEAGYQVPPASMG